MDLDELNAMWAEDCKIDELNLVSEAARIPKLHNKYFILYSKLGLKVKKLKSELVSLEKAKTEYYNGTMDQTELKERGWKPNPLKIIRQDMNKYIESDDDIIRASLNIDYHSSIVSYLEDIIKQINNRNFIITNMIKWSIFQAGG